MISVTISEHFTDSAAWELLITITIVAVVCLSGLSSLRLVLVGGGYVVQGASSLVLVAFTPLFRFASAKTRSS